MKKRIKYIILVAILFTTEYANSQQYLYEIGPTAGATFYTGDVNNNAFFQKAGSVYGLSLRRNFNFRSALKLDLLKGDISGDTRNSDNVMPVIPTSGLTNFKTNFFDVNAHLEYSFFSYSDSFKYKETRRFTPYIFTGLGYTFATNSVKTKSLNIPFGVGIKYKLFHRLNVGLEYSANMLLCDNIEQITDESYGVIYRDPYKTKASSFVKNRDWISYLKFYITFDIIERKCNCNK